MTGGATHVAAVKVRAKALEVAAELLQTPADALDIVDGSVLRKRSRHGGPSITLGEIARRSRRRSKLRGGARPGLAADGWFTPTT